MASSQHQAAARSGAHSDVLSPGPLWGGGQEFARRSVLYTLLDQHLRATTRFFAVAALVNEVFAHLFRRALIGVSRRSYAFSSELASSLEPVNLGYARSIHDGRLCGRWLDLALVRLEQQHVQRCWQGWTMRSGGAWRPVRRELNGWLNACHPVTLLAPLLPCSRQLAGVLAAVRQNLGVSISLTARIGSTSVARSFNTYAILPIEEIHGETSTLAFDYRWPLPLPLRETPPRGDGFPGRSRGGGRLGERRR